MVEELYGMCGREEQFTSQYLGVRGKDDTGRGQPSRAHPQ